MKRLVDTEEAAKILNVTPRSIRRWVESGKLKCELIAGTKGGGRAGQVLKVYINDDTETGRRGDTERKPKQKDPPTPGDERLRRASHIRAPQNTTATTVVHRGEPGCHIVTPFENGEPIITQNAERRAHGENQNINAPPLPISPPNTTHPTHAGNGGALIRIASNLPGIPTCSKQQHEGYLRLAILNAWRAKVEENHLPKGKITIEFLACYNSGLFYPYIYDKIGSISRATLYNWDRTEKLSGPTGLFPQYRGPEASPITEYEQYILLNTLLHQNRLKIGTAIKFTKTFLGYKKIPSPSNDTKLRRFANEFKRTRYDAWIKAREGDKALNDKCLPYAERNWRFLTVGEGLVADGHRLNFQVVNPFTGKLCRATIVLFWDWKSAYPLGWEIMIEENVQCIASALRNAILTLGKIPRWLLIDNGKAFKAKAFTSEVELEDGILYGMFATLGIHTHFSQAYNAQEKPLERFWGTFNNWFERLQTSYTGASINDKPASMLRNEKDAQARYNRYVPKIEEVQAQLHEFRKFYASQPSRGRGGKTPGELFEAERGPGVDPTELYHLMMVKEMKMVHRQGITWNGWHYYDEALYGLRDYILVKYSLSDFSQLYCFYKGKFLCIARPIEQSHPMASEAQFPKDHEAHKRIGALKNRVKRSTKNLLTLIESGGPIDAERDFRRSPDVADVIKAIEDKTKPDAPRISPFIGEPPADAEIPDVNPRTGRTVPMFNDEYEIYEWYRKRDPEALNARDRQWITKYESSAEWKEFYSQRGRIAMYEGR